MKKNNHVIVMLTGIAFIAFCFIKGSQQHVLTTAPIHDTIPARIMTYEVVISDSSGLVASRKDGKWIINDCQSALEQMYQSNVRSWKPVVVIYNEKDTVRYHAGDTLKFQMIEKTSVENLQFAIQLRRKS